MRCWREQEKGSCHGVSVVPVFSCPHSGRCECREEGTRRPARRTARRRQGYGAGAAPHFQIGADRAASGLADAPHTATYRFFIPLHHASFRRSCLVPSRLVPFCPVPPYPSPSCSFPRCPVAASNHASTIFRHEPGPTRIESVKPENPAPIRSRIRSGMKPDMKSRAKS